MSTPYGPQPGQDGADDPTRQLPPQGGRSAGQPYGQRDPYGADPYPPERYDEAYADKYADPRRGREPGRFSAAARAYGDPVGSGASFGVVGSTLAGIGAVLLIVAFVPLSWFADFPGGGQLSDVSNYVSTQSFTAGLADAYFGWLAWLLAAVLLVVAVAANLPSPVSGPLRALGAVLAAAAIAITFFAIQLRTTSTPGYSEYLKQARLGFYFALAGFLLMGIGALIGPRRR